MGALIGGGASLAVAVYTQRYQDRLQRIAQEVTKRETVYADFVMNVSNLLLTAYTRNQDEIALSGAEQRHRAHQPHEAFRSARTSSPKAEAVLKAIIEISLKPGVALDSPREALSRSHDPDPPPEVLPGLPG